MPFFHVECAKQKHSSGDSKHSLNFFKNLNSDTSSSQAARYTSGDPLQATTSSSDSSQNKAGGVSSKAVKWALGTILILVILVIAAIAFLALSGKNDNEPQNSTTQSSKTLSAYDNLLKTDPKNFNAQYARIVDAIVWKQDQVPSTEIVCQNKGKPITDGYGNMVCECKLGYKVKTK